ncbi:unnamed protein product, partial [Echinostoma caproni]|uniref:Uncharacterized protein n=1 Tax=Echinostoma caproni TaxID=27848 RepID=A0A183A380_9TREM
MIKSDCEGNKEMDPPDSRTNLLSRYLEEFVLSVQAPPTNLKWPDSGSDSMLSHYAHPKLCQAPCSSNSDEYRSIHSVSSPDEVLDLSTR